MKKRVRSVVAIVVALMMALPMFFAPVAFAASGNDVKVHLSNSLKSQISEIDYVTATIEGEEDDTAILHKQGNHFEGSFNNHYTDTSKALVSYVTIIWEDETEDSYYLLRESATGNGTINIWILDNADDNILDIEVTKDVNKDQAKVGEQVVFTITAENHGSDDAVNLEIEDILPSGLVFVSADPATAYDEDTGIWEIDELDEGATATLTITATIDDVEVGTVITNIASLVGEDDDNSNNSDSADVEVIQTPVITEGFDIAVTKTVDKATAKVAEQVVFTVTVTNNGPENADNVVVQDASPNGLINVNAVAGKGTYVTGVWTIGALTVSESAVLTVTGTIEGLTENMKIINTATFTGEDNDSSNNTDTASVDLVTDDPDPDDFDLTVAKVWEDADGEEINPPGDTTVTINVLKGGEPTDLSVTFPQEDATPWSHVFEGLEAGNYSVVEATVPTGFSVTYSANVLLSANVPTGTITVTNTEDGDDPGDPEDPELTITKSVTPSSREGSSGTFTYTLVISYDGGDGELVLYDAEVEDVFTGPAGATYTYNYSGGEGEPTFDPDTKTFNLGDMEDGDVITITYTVDITGFGTHDNKATVTGWLDEEETLTDDDDASVRLTRPDRDRDRDRDRDDDSDVVVIPDDPTPEGPAPVDPIVDIPEEEVPLSPVPQTGVNDNIALMAFLMLGSLAGIGAMMRRRSIER